jgi:hypothetical protein
MESEADPIDLLGREPDEALLEEESRQLPAAVGQPEALPPPSPARRRVVALGATLTGVSLVLGIALIGVGIGEVISDAAVLGIALLVVGVLLIGTHWGWVHVAELTGNAIQGQRDRAVLKRRQAWLLAVEPYPRWEVSTSAGEDGSITILTVRRTPVPHGEQKFTFVSEEVAREVHSGDEPAAEVAERAELLRREAAAETERARQRFEVARDAYDNALMARDDEQQRVAALRAASQALSDQINANLRDPPLTESAADSPNE